MESREEVRMDGEGRDQPLGLTIHTKVFREEGLMAQHGTTIPLSHLASALEKAVEVALEELKKNPPPVLRKPAFPSYGKAAGR